MTSSDPNLGYHLQHIIQGIAPNVDQYDGSYGVFGELISPDIVFKGIQETSDNVGKIDDPTSALATQAVHSFVCQDPNYGGGNEVKITVQNQTQSMIVLRWVDEKGFCYPHFQWLIEPHTSKIQYSRYGHLFILSIILSDSDRGGGEEQLLGAYRIRMSKPSGSGHCIRISEDELVQKTTTTEEEEDEVSFTTSFHVENVLNLNDDNSTLSGGDGGDGGDCWRDEMIVACASLDAATMTTTASKTKTIKTLSTILNNLQKNPNEPKFRSLRLNNPTVQKTIGTCWGARQLLSAVGFQERLGDAHYESTTTTREEFLVLDETTTTNDSQQQDKLKQATSLLNRLRQRSRPGFVPELDLGNPPPWIGPVLVSTTTNARAFGSGNGTHFLSDDEKWERAERNRKRRGRAGRRPDPGNAPSSNGRWGR